MTATDTPSLPTVFIVESQDDEGHSKIERVFSTREAADEYASQFPTSYWGSSVDVIERSIDAVAPRRYTHYSLVGMFTIAGAASHGRAIGPSQPLPTVEQFDEDNLAIQAREIQPLTTEPVKVTVGPAPSLWRVVRAYGTDKAAVRAAYDEAVAQVIAEARAITARATQA